MSSPSPHLLLESGLGAGPQTAGLPDSVPPPHYTHSESHLLPGHLLCNRLPDGYPHRSSQYGSRAREGRYGKGEVFKWLPLSLTALPKPRSPSEFLDGEVPNGMSHGPHIRGYQWVAPEVDVCLGPQGN
jgi:hypothetical protein